MMRDMPAEGPGGSGWLPKIRMKTRQLLLLTALDEQRSLQRASEQLHMTQPATSRLLKELEEALGVQLFERLPRGMEPTLYGATMIRHARMALTSLALAQDEIQALKAGLSGQVEVGAIMTPAMNLLPSAITRVKQEAPLLRVGVQVEASNVLLEQLRRGALDFMVGRILEKEGTAGLVYEELTEEKACAVVRTGHPLLGCGRLHLRDIANRPWILPPPGSLLRHRCDMMFYGAGLEPPADVVDANSPLLIAALLQKTDALHVMPVEVARYYAGLNVLSILPLELPFRMEAFGIISKAGHLMSPGANMLLQAVRRAAKELY